MAYLNQQDVLALLPHRDCVVVNVQREEPVAAVALQQMPRTDSHSYKTYFTAGGNVRIPSSLS